MGKLSNTVDYSFRCTLRRITIVPMIGLTLFCGLLLAMIGYLLSTMFWANHANEVISEGLAAEKALLDIQTGTRGYYLTADDSFLQPYKASRPEAPRALSRLREMVKDNPDQSSLADRVSTDAETWLAWVDQTLVTTTGTKERPTNESIREGKRMFDIIRADLAAFLGNEMSLRDHRTANTMRIAGLTVGLSVLAFLVFGFWQAHFTRHGLRMTTDRYRQAIELSERRNEQIKAVVRELDSEFKAVAEIQRSLLPLKLPHIPLLRLAASYQTSKRAGGDYYDFFRLPVDDSVPADQAKWGVLIADVSGHGTPAAVLMAVTHAIAHGIERPLDAPSKLLGFVNERLCQGYTSENAAFVTAFFGIYDPVTRSLEYSSAGHNPPRFLARDAKVFQALDNAQGLPLGVQAGEEYPNALLRMDIGDTLVLYTDGWVEARDADDILFGVDRLEKVFEAVAHRSPSQMIVHALHALKSYVGDQPPQDDCTLLVLQMTDRPDEAAPTQTVLSVDTTVMSEVDAVLASEPPMPAAAL